ncbi:MAG TPA: hypothetical protein VF557_20240 [Jatrophihabitans sp.]|uniref:hypothetical protein n=1 Tax=Jatrophihabitans sp. TaxID=1932789 RepID=UPI002EFE56D7
MGRDDAHPDDIDWLDVGPDGAPGEMTPPRRPWPRWFTLTVVALAAALVVAALNYERGGTPSAARGSAAPTTPTSSSTQAGPRTPTTSAPRPAGPAVSVTRLGRPLLGATTGWELVARGDRVLVRIEPATGRITRTAIPTLLSGGPVYLLAGEDQVLIRPLDKVPGYLVPDGRPARELPALLEHDGPVYPGPRPDQMWARPSDDHQPVMALMELDGSRLAEFIPIPSENLSFDATADGAGYLLFPGIGGVYNARPDGLRRISTGSLVAVGPTGWLVTECDDRHRCQSVVIDRRDGSRRVVNAAITGRQQRGVISPDGATAAMLTSARNGAIGLQLLDLATGNRRVLNVSVNQSYEGAIAFSPDSNWLLAVTVDGTLSVINRKTAAVGSLGVPLPPLSQLVLRPAR